MNLFFRRQPHVSYSFIFEKKRLYFSSEKEYAERTSLNLFLRRKPHVSLLSFEKTEAALSPGKIQFDCIEFQEIRLQGIKGFDRN